MTNDYNKELTPEIREKLAKIKHLSKFFKRYFHLF